MLKIYGKNVVKEALRANHQIEIIYLEQAIAKKDLAFVNLLKDKQIAYQFVDKSFLDHMFKGLHQGYGAKVAHYKTHQLEDIINNKQQLILVLDGIEDPHNLGAIVRCADAFNVDAIVIPKNSNVQISSTVVKVSTGAMEYVKIVVVNNLVNALQMLKKQGFWIVGTDASARKSVKDIDNTTSLAIVIGSEGFGIRQLVAKTCDYLVKIPMYGHVNSLNASVSAGIILSHIRK